MRGLDCMAGRQAGRPGEKWKSELSGKLLEVDRPERSKKPARDQAKRKARITINRDEEQQERVRESEWVALRVKWGRWKRGWDRVVQALEKSVVVAYWSTYSTTTPWRCSWSMFSFEKMDHWYRSNYHVVESIFKKSLNITHFYLPSAHFSPSPATLSL